MPASLAFTDEQIAAIMDAAQPLARAYRAAFREVQGRYLDAPKWGTR
jgi:hypothetical protein